MANPDSVQLEINDDCTSCLGDVTRKLTDFGPYGVRLCERCGLLFVSPRPSVEELGKIYQQEYFDGTGQHGNPEGYQSQASGYRARAHLMVDWIKRQTGLNSGYWLDVGCGPGHLVEAAQNAGFQAEGIDISDAAVQMGRKMGLQLSLAPAEHLPANDSGRFQVVTMFDSLFHVRSPHQVLKEVSRVLAAGGFLFAGPFDLHTLDWKPSQQARDMTNWGIPEHLSFVNQTSMQYVLKMLEFERIRFLAMPATPTDLAKKQASWLPGWLVTLARKLLRWFPWLQRLVHKAASRYVERQAGYVLAQKR